MQLGSLVPAAGKLVDIQDQLLRILTHHMIYLADRLGLLPHHMARARIAKDPANELGILSRFQLSEDRGLQRMPMSFGPQHPGAGDSKFAKQPRQAVITSDNEILLPLEQCQTCKKMKRQVTLRNGHCSECQLGKFSAEIPSHLISTKNMDDQDQATYLMDGNTSPLHVTPVPLWEQCVWCGSKSGPDGRLCDGCLSSNNSFYAIEHTNISSQWWDDLLAETSER